AASAKSLSPAEQFFRSAPPPMVPVPAAPPGDSAGAPAAEDDPQGPQGPGGSQGRGEAEVEEPEVMVGARESIDVKAGQPPAPFIETLVTRQLVAPLRRDILRLIEPPSGREGREGRDASPTAASKRASDVYRVWKGVRTDLLGEGLVYAVFHQGLLDAVRGN